MGRKSKTPDTRVERLHPKINDVHVNALQVSKAGSQPCPLQSVVRWAARPWGCHMSLDKTRLLSSVTNGKPTIDGKWLKYVLALLNALRIRDNSSLGLFIVCCPTQSGWMKKHFCSPRSCLTCMNSGTRVNIANYLIGQGQFDPRQTCLESKPRRRRIWFPLNRQMYRFVVTETISRVAFRSSSRHNLYRSLPLW